jgi:hypothetical protein
VGTEQRENLDAILRQSVFPAGADVVGDAFFAADLASQVGRRTGANVVSELELETAGAVTLTVCDVVDWPVVAA